MSVCVKGVFVFSCGHCSIIRLFKISILWDTFIHSSIHSFIHSFIHSSIRNINHNGHNCFVHSKILWLQTKSGSLLCIMQVWNDRSVFFLPLQYPGLTRWLYLIICYISERRVHEFGTDFTAGRRKSKTER